MTNQSGGVTIKSIAERLGVSFSTVSKALNGDPTVKPETRALVEETAKEKGHFIYKGIVNSGDAFYYDPAFKETPPYPLIAGEMESFALFTNARYLGKKAACLLTISDKKDAVTTPEERQTAFKGMIEIALDSAIEL